MNLPSARLTDPVTSHEAAASVRVAELPEIKRTILTLLSVAGPMTDDELWNIWQERITHQKISPSGLRTRRRELADAGLVRDSGEKRPLESGRLAIVWEAS